MNGDNFYPVCIAFQSELMFNIFCLITCHPVKEIFEQGGHVQISFYSFLVEDFRQVQYVGEAAFPVF